MKVYKILIISLLVIFLLSLFIPVYNYFHSTKCNNLSEQIGKLIKDKNYCSVDSDCIVSDVGFGCSCYQLINSNEDMTKVTSYIEEYKNKECGYIYLWPGMKRHAFICDVCPTTPNQDQILCKNNKCVDSRFE